MIMKTSLSSAMGRPHCGLALTLQLMTLFRSHNLSHNPLNPTQRAWFGQNCRHTVLPLQDQNGKSSDILRSRGLGEDSARPVSCFSCCVSKQFSPSLTVARLCSVSQTLGIGIERSDCGRSMSNRNWAERSYFRPVWKRIQQALLNFELSSFWCYSHSSCFHNWKRRGKGWVSVPQCGRPCF